MIKFEMNNIPSKTYKIIIDSTPLLHPLTGIGKYTNEIAKRLEKKDIFDINYYYGYYSQKRIEINQTSQMKFIKAFIMDRPLLKKIVRKILRPFNKLFIPTFDLHFAPNLIPITGIKASKTVTTVHDFSFYIHPEWHPQERLDYFDKYFFTNVKQSDWIITGSEFSKKEIIKYLKFTKENITVIHHGVDHNMYKIYDDNILNITKDKLELSDNFLLFVGSIEPRKNLLHLIKAYKLLDEKIKEKFPLILVGFKGWENDEIMIEIRKEQENIKYLGYLTDKELAYVYNLATVFIYPSLYEGFGIPPLEAMACGTAVISSNAASLPEVCADSALYIDPLNIEDIKDKLQMLLLDELLQEDMIKKGLHRVKQFTWEKSTQKHIEVFEKVLN